MRRRLALFVAIAVLLPAAAALLVHAPFVRARLLQYAVTTLEQQYGIRVEAERLDYNLVSLRAGLAGVRVAAAGKQPPFFEADYVAVTVPRRTLFGEVAIDDVSVSNGVVRIVQTASGESNLPESTGPPGGEPEPLPIARLAVMPLRVDVRNEQSGFALDVPAAAVDLSADEGRIALAQPATVRVGKQQTTLRTLEGPARFDGRTLHLDDVDVEADEARVRVSGPVTVIANDPAVDLHVEGSGDVARLARWGMEEGDTPRGSVTFMGSIAGPMTALTTELDVASPRIDWQELTVANISAAARVTPDALTIDRAAFDIDGGHINGSAALPLAADPEARPLIARVRADALIQLQDRPPPFVPLALPGESRLAVADGTWRLQGQHRVGGVAPATLVLGGRLAEDLTRSTVTGNVAIGDTDVPALASMLRRADLADVPADSVPAGRIRGDARVAGTFARTRIDFTAASDALRLANPAASGPAGIAGTFDTGTERYTFDVTLTDWLIEPAADLPLSGRVTAALRGSGRAADVTAEGEVTAHDVAWQDTMVGEVTATVMLDPQLAHIVAASPQFNATVDARVATTAPYMTSMTARVNRLDLARVLGTIETPVPLAGSTSLMLEAEGPIEQWRAGAANLRVTEFDATAGDLPIRLLEPASFQYRRERIAIERLEASAGETHVSASGEIAAFAPANGASVAGSAADGIIATIAGDVGEVARAVAATRITDVPVMGGSGPVALLARVAGSLEAPLVSADVEIGPGAITLTDLPTISDLRVRTHVADGWIDLREAHGVYQGATVNGTGRVPLSLLGVDVPGVEPGEASLRATITGVTAAVLEPFLDPSAAGELSGSVDATVSVDTPALDVAALRGTLQLDRLELRIADLPVTQRVPTRVVLREGFARVEAWDWTGEGARLGVQGQVRLSDLQAGILANGEVDLRMATPFVRAAGLTTAGSLQPRLSITGVLTDPRIDGDILVSGAEMRLVDPRIILSDLNGRAVLTRSTASLPSLTGFINGGSFTGEGNAEMGADGRMDARFASTIRSMPLEFPPGLRSEMDADLVLTAVSAPGEETPSGRIEGSVTMLRGSYRETLAVVTGLLANVRAASAVAAAETPDSLDRLALDIRVVSDEDLVVDNNVGRFELGADLRVIGTAAVPALSGRAELREGGQLFVGRNVYTITSGTIDFANPTVIEPNLNLELSTRAGGEDIEVTIAGTPETLSVDLRSSSDPDLGQADLTALLVTGRRLDQLSTDDAALIGAQVLGNFSADLLGFAGRAIGLDTLRIGGIQTEGTLADSEVMTTELDPTSRLTFGKSFGNLNVTLSQSLRDGDAQTWIVDYLPSRQIELRLVSDDDNLFSYGFRHDLSFGGTPRAAAARAAPRRAEARVASVMLTGELIVAEERLRDALSLSEGDVFDFSAWQDDRDRMLALYHELGYLTTRVNATRTEGDAGVALTYSIVAGPRTEIVVRGVALPDAVMSELRAAWTDTVFESFLVDEATDIVRRALARQGSLQGQVMARVESSPEALTLTIDVMPGPRTQAVTVRMQGVDEALAEKLSAEIVARGLVDSAATDPARVEQAVTDSLRQAGYLAARVAVGAPLFEGDTAVVPFTVTPGNRIAIGSVNFEGVEGLSVEQVREAAELPTDIPADPSAIDAARERVVALYRREGFASAAATIRQAVRSGEAISDVTFVVIEGPRQVLAGIAVSGNRSIDPDVVERALNLTVNQPLRPQEWLQARSRVFDTGLFRRVDVSSEPVADAPPVAGVQPMRMRVVVEEWPALRARYGVQLAEERPEDNVEGRDLVPGLTADVTRRTLFGRAVTVGAAAGLQRRERLGRIFVNAPTMIGLPVQSSLILERARRDFAADTLVTETSSVAWEQRARISPTLTLSYAYRFEENHTFDTQPNDPTLPFDILVHVGRLTSSGAWDTRDDPADTTRGALVSTSLELAAEPLASEISYLRWLTQAYYFKPWRGIVFASAARTGLVGALGGQDLLSSFQFFLGGARTVRGVEEDALRGRDIFGDPITGKGLLVLNQEVRFPIYRWLRGVGFIDAGTLLPDTRIAFEDMTTSSGFGLRLTTPFGVLRADYGRVFASPNGGEPGSGRWTVGIGQAF